jgi:hypothetical protein
LAHGFHTTLWYGSEESRVADKRCFFRRCETADLERDAGRGGIVGYKREGVDCRLVRAGHEIRRTRVVTGTLGSRSGVPGEERDG